MAYLQQDVCTQAINYQQTMRMIEKKPLRLHFGHSSEGLKQLNLSSIVDAITELATSQNCSHSMNLTDCCGANLGHQNWKVFSVKYDDRLSLLNFFVGIPFDPKNCNSQETFC